MKNRQEELFQAIHNNNSLEQIAQIIKEGGDVNGLHNMQLPLIAAIQQGNYALTEFFLNNGAEINLMSSDQTALMSSIWSPNSGIFDLLIARGADVNQSNSVGMVALTCAINSEKEHFIQTLLNQSNINVNPAITGGQTPLTAASMKINGGVELVQTLIKMGANINPAITGGQTPLIAAASIGNLPVVQILLEQGAEVNPTTNSFSPLTAAAMRGDLNIINLLLEKGAEINPVNVNQTSLIASIQTGKEEAFTLLMQRGADANLVTNNNETPLGVALRQGAHGLAIKLLNHGAKATAQDNNGSLLLATLIGSNNPELLELLITKGIDINAKDSFDGKTILDMAIGSGKHEMIEILKKHGAEASAVPEQPVPVFSEPVLFSQPVVEPYIWIDPMIAKTEELELSVKNKDIKAIEQILQEGYWGNFDWSLIKNAITAENRETSGSLLITAIRQDKPELVKILFENNVHVDQKQLMSVLCGDHHINYNIILPMLLEQKTVKIDWNQVVDEQGNNLMMKLCNKHQEWIIFQNIATKNSEGLPIFEINHTNKAGQKLIDLCKIKLDNANYVAIKDGISLLRKLGSSEPASPIMPCYILDTQNVHNDRNEKIIHELMKELHSRHNLDEVAIKKSILYIEEYIINNKARLSLELGLEEKDLDTAVQRLKMLQEKDQYPSDEHNTKWLFTEELGYICTEANESGRVGEVIKRLACLPEGSCNWGFLVQLYSAVEEEKGADHPPVIQFHKFEDPDAYYKLADKAIELLKESGLSTDQIKTIVSKFHKEVTEKRNKFQDVSVESELLKGIFHKVFVGLAEVAGHNESDIYSDDCTKFYTIVQMIIDCYQWSEDYNETTFYEILHATESELNIDIAGDNNSLDLLQ